ncbi:MAG: riboflavin synthase [Deltaproteobacteria bacterium CG11_big_fil_rev_8_21_14_0_20_45_16]|nr:MAG: riboflavin synthase [Deltaproteobacteria bacterium CG11_big_fil_rev_8_21_14_0_20_45_16]
MFTGIIQKIAELKEIRFFDKSVEMLIGCENFKTPLQIGDSLAINGVCLTVTEIETNSFKVQVSPETLSRTNLGGLEAGQLLNLERACRADSFLNGHIVQGHIDSLAEILNVDAIEDYFRIHIQAPAKLSRYLVEKASIAIDGISLTVNKVESGTSNFEVMIIPHTWEQTIAHAYHPGTQVNIEIDIFAKYVEKLLHPPKLNKPETLWVVG